MPPQPQSVHIASRNSLLKLVDCLSRLDEKGVRDFFLEHPDFDADTVAYGHTACTAWGDRDGIFCSSGQTPLRAILRMAVSVKLFYKKANELVHKEAPSTHSWLKMAHILIEKGANIHEPSLLSGVIEDVVHHEEMYYNKTEKDYKVKLKTRAFEVLNWFSTYQVAFNQNGYTRHNIFSLMMNASRATHDVLMYMLEKTENQKECWHFKSRDGLKNLLWSTLYYQKIETPAFQKIMNEQWSLEEWLEAQENFEKLKLNLSELSSEEKELKRIFLENKIEQVKLHQKLPKAKSKKLIQKNRI